MNTITLSQAFGLLLILTIGYGVFRSWMISDELKLSLSFEFNHADRLAERKARVNRRRPIQHKLGRI
jgi:hypothetical protein